MDNAAYKNLAFLYSKKQDKEAALQYLEKALQLGYDHFVHMEQETDLDYIRNLKEYKTLIERYNKE